MNADSGIVPVVKATVRRFHSPDADPAGYTPDDDCDVGVLVQIFAGPADVPGEESFDVIVCTPAWLQRVVAEQGPLIGRHYVIVERFAWPAVREFLTRQVEACAGDDWPTVGEKLARLGRWEFEDYVP